MGTSASPVTVQSNLFEGVSEPLHALMNNGSMVGSRSRRARLDDVDLETFMGLCEYAYTRDYLSCLSQTEAQGEHLRHSGLLGHEHRFYLESAVLCHTASTLFSGSLAKEARRGRSPRPDLGTRNGALWQEFQLLVLHPNPDKLAGPHSAATLRCNAKLWVLAERYLVESLKQLTLARLHRNLCLLKLNEANIDLVVDLLQYVYANTSAVEWKHGSIRDVISHYAASEVDVLAKNARFREVMCENGEIGADLVSKLAGNNTGHFA